MIKAIIFDMDGTVIDSTQHDYAAWKRVFAAHGFNFSYEDFVSVLGAKGTEIIKNRLDLEQNEIEQMLAKKEIYFKEEIDKKGLALIPHVEDLLKEIKAMGLKTALATGAGNEKLQMVFRRLQIRQYFDAFVTADDVTNGKPNPEVFLNAAQKLGTPPEQSVVIEDAENGIEAAKAGNMFCIAIITTHKREKLIKADLIVNNYQELNIQRFIENHTS